MRLYTLFQFVSFTIITIFGITISIHAKDEQPTVVDAHKAECQKDFPKCSDNADMVCKQQVNDSVKYGDPEWSWVPFGSFYNGDDYVRTGISKLADKDVKIQNAFGAKVHSLVECWYDFNKGSALIVKASGR